MLNKCILRVVLSVTNTVLAMLPLRHLYMATSVCIHKVCPNLRTCALFYYVLFLSINSASSVFTLKIPKRKSAL